MLRSLIIAILFVSTGAGGISAGPLPIFRISTENTDQHVQTIAVKRFADELQALLGEQLDVRFYPNAQRFRDRDVVQALIQGRVEMAVPGTWHVAQYKPDVGVFLLPFFYGRPADVTYTVLDSDAGRLLTLKIETGSDLKVLGRWIDLGHAHLFSLDKKIRTYKDIDGLRVRVAGGTANMLRVKAMGGRPTSVAWPDLPYYLKNRRIDGILTSYETVASARLWEMGIRYVFEDRQYFPQYIPLIRFSFWQKLTPELQTVIQSTWEKHVDTARAEAAAAQVKARQTALEHGIEMIVPEEAQIVQWRNRLMAYQAEFSDILQIDAQLVRRIAETLPEY